MPIYEYDCLDCGRRVSVFYRTIREASDGVVRCPHCQGRLRRRVSRVAVLRPEGSRLDDYADSALLAGLDREDPRAMAGLMRKMEKELGEPLDPQTDEIVGRLEAGESPKEIEATLPAPGRDAPTGGEKAQISGSGADSGADTAG